jgi:hypothetical protein
MDTEEQPRHGEETLPTVGTKPYPTVHTVGTNPSFAKGVRTIDTNPGIR